MADNDHSEKAFEPESQRKLFLGGLNYNTTEDGLTAHFEQYGEIVDVIVMKFPDSKRSRGFGFVTFSKTEETEKCYADCPHVIDDTEIETKRATPKEEMHSKDGRGGGRDSESYRKVFVGGLSYQTDDEGLKAHFSQFGTLVDSIVMKFRDTRRSRGFGFVTYSTVAEVDECQKNRPHKIDGKVVETKRATPREDAESQRGGSVTRLFIGGLKYDGISDDDLRSYFEKFGAVTSIEQMTEKSTGKKRGFGFVEFDDYDSVDKVLLEQKHFVKDCRIFIEKSSPRSNLSGNRRFWDNELNRRSLKREFPEYDRGFDERNCAQWSPWSFDAADSNYREQFRTHFNPAINPRNCNNAYQIPYVPIGTLQNNYIKQEMSDSWNNVNTGMNAIWQIPPNGCSGSNFQQPLTWTKTSNIKCEMSPVYNTMAGVVMPNGPLTGNGIAYGSNFTGSVNEIGPMKTYIHGGNRSAPYSVQRNAGNSAGGGYRTGGGVGGSGRW